MIQTVNIVMQLFKVARLDFWGGIPPKFEHYNYVGISKDMGKRLSQLYHIKIKISYDLGFIAIAWQRNEAITFFIYLCVSLYQEFFFKKSLKGVCTCHNCLNYVIV